MRRTADQDILVADVQLTRMVILDTVRAVAERDRVNRNERTPDVSGTEQSASSVAVSADQQGDLNAMAATIPGVTPILSAEGDPAGFSVLGLSADQNSMTLNGANLGSSTLPRDAQVSTSLVTAPYDVSRGGFSGAQLNVRSGSGTNFIRRNNSLNFDAPSLQWTDPAARALGQQYTNVSLGGSLVGADRVRQGVLQRRVSARPPGERSAHAAQHRSRQGWRPRASPPTRSPACSPSRRSQDIPLGNGLTRSSRLRDNGSLFGTFDLTPPTSTTGTTYKLVLNGNWNRQTPASNLTTELPAHSGDRTNWGAGAQLQHTSYLKQILLSETTVSLGGNKNYGSPYTLLPNGTVLVNSDVRRRHERRADTGFGGSSNLNTSSTGLTTELQNQLSWFSRNNKHRLKLSSELQYDGYDQDQTTNLLGTFGYNSLADLAANRPAFYTRSLYNRIQSASAVTAALALGDSYRRTSNLQIQYGLRLDANRFNATPAYNSDVEQLFKARNDVTPNKLYVSPRIGFSWTYGTAAQIAAFEGAVRNPRAVVRGGIGVFQSTPNANLIGNAVDNTGLATAVQQLSCVGTAVPIPDWGTYASNPGAVPEQCADGSLGSVFASNVPNVNLFAKDFQSPRSVRSNLNWSGPILGNRLAANWDITYSVNLNQSSNYDLNFQPTQRFALADEAGRPVYVQPGSIVPATGAIASRDARVSQLFNRVQELRSDLRSETKQFRIGISPQTFSQRYNWSLNYTIADVREQYRGFQSTIGNPRDIAWSRSGGRVAPPDHVQPVLQLLRRRARELVRPDPQRIAVHARHRRRRERRRLLQRPRVHLRPGDDRRPRARRGDALADRQQHRLGARLPALAARHARRAQLVHGPVDDEREPQHLVQPAQGAAAAARHAELLRLQPARRRRSPAARPEQAARLGADHLRRSHADVRARLRQHGDSASGMRSIRASAARTRSSTRSARRSRSRCPCASTSARRASGSSSRRCSIAGASSRARRSPSSSSARSTARVGCSTRWPSCSARWTRSASSAGRRTASRA